MILLQTLLAFAVALGSLIIVHELGHYWVARLCGVKVLRFSVGMGKVIFSRRFGADQTEWAISILPLGGYVKMLDAREQDIGTIAAADLPREFTRQSVWRRIAIVAAGPLANFLLAILLFAGIYMHGTPEPLPKLGPVAEQSVAYQAGLRGGELVTAVNGETIQTWDDMRWKLTQAAVDHATVKLDVRHPDGSASGGNILETVNLPLDSVTTKDLESDFLAKLGIVLAFSKAKLEKVLPDGAAMKAGLHDGDVITSIDGHPIADGMALIDKVKVSAGQTLHVGGLRNGQEGQNFQLDLTPEAQERDGKVIGQIKVEISFAPEMIVATSPPLAALVKGAQKTWDTSILTLKMLGKMLIGQVSVKNITGPITIADYAGQTARIGVISYLSFIAFISLSLGVMNLLPIPVLDGGFLLYYSVEVLTGRPVPERIWGIAQRAGFGVLMMLMVVAMFNDIVRLIF